MAPKGLKRAFEPMIEHLSDLAKVEARHARLREGEVVRSRAVGSPV